MCIRDRYKSFAFTTLHVNKQVCTYILSRTVDSEQNWILLVMVIVCEPFPITLMSCANLISKPDVGLCLLSQLCYLPWHPTQLLTTQHTGAYNTHDVHVHTVYVYQLLTCCFWSNRPSEVCHPRRVRPITAGGRTTHTERHTRAHDKTHFTRATWRSLIVCTFSLLV